MGEDRTKINTIVIGSGPAGISAAVYLKRANIDVLVISKDGGTLAGKHEIENYYPFAKIDSSKIQEMGVEQAKSLGIGFVNAEIINIEKDFETNTYILTDNTDNKYKAKYIFLALGRDKKIYSFKGFKDFEGKGISYCAVCDAFFYKTKDIAILGNTKYTIEEIKNLENIVNKIYIITDEEPIEELKEYIDGSNMKDKYILIKNKIDSLEGEERLEKIVFKDSTQIEVSALFIAENLGSKTISTKLGLMLNGQDIVVDKNMKTNVDGIYAGGDCTLGMKQIAKAVYDGMQAAMGIMKDLRGI